MRHHTPLAYANEILCYLANYDKIIKDLKERVRNG